MIERTLAGLSRSVKEVIEQRGREREEWRRNAIELAVSLAARLLQDQFEAGSFPIEARARDMIGEVGPGPVTVALHPEDVRLLEGRLAGKPLLEGREDLRIVADPEVKRCDCRVEVGEDILLSQLSVQLSEMRDRLLRSLDNART